MMKRIDTQEIKNNISYKIVRLYIEIIQHDNFTNQFLLSMQINLFIKKKEFITTIQYNVMIVALIKRKFHKEMLCKMLEKCVK